MGTSTTTSPKNLGTLNGLVQAKDFLTNGDINDVFSFSINQETNLLVSGITTNSSAFVAQAIVQARFGQDKDGDGQFDANELLDTKPVTELTNSRNKQEIFFKNLSSGTYFLEVKLTGFSNLSDPDFSGTFRTDYEIDIASGAKQTPATLSITSTNFTNDIVISEGNLSNQNLNFIIARTGNTQQATTVNWTLGGGTGLYKVDSADFAGGVLPQGTVSFASGQTSKTITVQTQGDINQEFNETFAVTLSNPSSNATIKTATVTGTILNDDFIGKSTNDTLTGTTGNDYFNGGAGADTYTSLGGSDTFVFEFGHSTLALRDRINDFAIGLDKIDLLTQGGGAMNAPNSFSRAADSNKTTVQDIINQVFTDANGGINGNQALGKNSASVVRATALGVAGTYLVVNDNTAGFQPNNDLVINITGFGGTLSSPRNISVSEFFV